MNAPSVVERTEGEMIWGGGKGKKEKSPQSRSKTAKYRYRKGHWRDVRWTSPIKGQARLTQTKSPVQRWRLRQCAETIQERTGLMERGEDEPIQ